MTFTTKLAFGLTGAQFTMCFLCTLAGYPREAVMMFGVGVASGFLASWMARVDERIIITKARIQMLREAQEFAEKEDR